ncbi:flagellar hook-basal body complex protein [Thioclava sp. FR2]|uniref:flagellar hook-basal body complex protein n=1 Tax=Thioclava sp. FR2 TaxID=3445780 RepID=UPI003EBE0E9E
MEAAGYTTLTRQTGLINELQVLAHNISNASTTGFRREGVVFSEYISASRGEESISMAHANVRHVDLSQGALTRTGGKYDLAIQGEGFFLVATPEGERLTRSGAFFPSAEGTLVTADGFALLDSGGAPIPVPTGAKDVSISKDGTMTADGVPVAEIALWEPENPSDLRRQSGTLIMAQGWSPVASGTILQGHLEESNVNTLSEIARMIEVQRAYEMGQRFLDSEDQRQKSVLQTLGR